MTHLFDYDIRVPHLWFRELTSDSLQDLAIICAIVGVTCIAKTGLGTILFVFYNTQTIKRRKCRQTRCRRLLHHTAATLITVLDIALGYMLMFAFMLFNLWICVTIVVTSVLAYFFISWSHRHPHPQLVLEKVDSPESESTETAALSASKETGNERNILPLDLTNEQRKSVEASQLISMSTFHRNQLEQYDELEPGETDEASTLLIRPDILAQEGAVGGAGESFRSARDKSGSDQLLDKYPLLKFHNVDVKDTSPVPDRKSKSLDFDELDQLIKDLKQS